MDCNDTRRFLETDADGELDLVRHLELEAHLKTCADCARRADTIRARRSALQDALPRFNAPPQLAAKIKAALENETRSASTTPSKSRRLFAFSPLWGSLGVAASVMIALFAGYTWGDSHARENLLINEAVSDHVRSLEANHLTDVASTDQHTVKPWFAGKIDFSPPVVDLASSGFPLIGGRLEQLGDRTTAALVFHRRQHPINLFIWPANGSSVTSHKTERNGYHTESWSQNGFNFLAVSEIPAAELIQFADDFRNAQH
ncbi:MAG TPA: anti-sigma factor [Lacunisphaera sp.]|jgi:anti-sigma factor RsiW